MSGKEQISLSLAFVVVAVILLAGGQVMAKPAYKDGVVRDPKLEEILKDLIETTQRIKEKATKVGNSPQVHQCEKNFGESVENLNKALDLYKKGISTQEGFNELEAFVKEAEKGYNKCDKVFADEYKPSPFSVYDTWLKQMAVTAEKGAESGEDKV